MDRSQAVELLSAEPDATGIFSDFDGTLAQIVDAPADATPVPGAVETIHALAKRYARVGVLSGRPAAFLHRHLRGNALLLSGLYGMEHVAEGEVEAIDEAREWCPVVAGAVAAAHDELPAGLLVEDKGLSLTVHYRPEPALAGDAEAWAESAAAKTGLVVRAARLSFELCPPLSRSKGTVLIEYAAGLDTVCFAGDDYGDLTAFDALDELADEGCTTVRIGVASAEAPAELLERADLTLSGPDDTVAFLRELVRR